MTEEQKQRLEELREERAWEYFGKTADVSHPVWQQKKDRTAPGNALKGLSITVIELSRESSNTHVTPQKRAIK